MWHTFIYGQCHGCALDLVNGFIHFIQDDATFIKL